MDIPLNQILVGDAEGRLKEIPDGSIHTCVTSPPYFGLRNYGVDGQIGLEETPGEYVEKLVKVFREVKRVLRDDGTLWLNLGDSYSGAGYSNHKNTGGAQREDGGKPKHLMGSGLKPKNLLGIPWQVAFGLQKDDWYLRSDIIWAKPNPMPESVSDRPTKAHEYVFLLSKSDKYYYDTDAAKEPISESGRPQQKRAMEIAKEGNLTEAHLQAIRAAGCTDAGKAQVTQTGFGKNTEEVQQLAKEAKDVLGGYYREFLTSDGRRNRRTVWIIASEPFREAHFATFPEALVEPCLLAGCPPGGTVLDPFMGSGTTALVALKAGRNFIGIELNPEYAKICEGRIANERSQMKLF